MNIKIFDLGFDVSLAKVLETAECPGGRGPKHIPTVKALNDP